MKTLTAQKMKCSCALLLAAIVFSMLSPLPGLCQSDDLAAAKAVSEKSFDTLKTGKADEYAKLMMPSELDRFKSAILLIADMAKAKGQEQQILTLLEAPDRASLEKLTSEEFLARVMKRQMTPEVIESTSKADFKIIGQVKEGDETVHCVYSLSIPGDIVAARTNVVSLKKSESGWGMLLTSDLDKMFNSPNVQTVLRTSTRRSSQ